MLDLSHMGKGDWKSWLSFFYAWTERGWNGKGVILFHNPRHPQLGALFLNLWPRQQGPTEQAMLLE